MAATTIAIVRRRLLASAAIFAFASDRSSRVTPGLSSTRGLLVVGTTNVATSQVVCQTQIGLSWVKPEASVTRATGTRDRRVTA